MVMRGGARQHERDTAKKASIPITVRSLATHTSLFSKSDHINVHVDILSISLASHEHYFSRIFLEQFAEEVYDCSMMSPCAHDMYI